MKRRILTVSLGAAFMACLGWPSAARAQAVAGRIKSVLAENILPPPVADFEVRQYIEQHVAPLPQAASAAEWTAKARQLRRHLLKDVVFHGWPSAWTDAPLKFEDLGIFYTAADYRMRKLRIEVLPGFQTTAILYEPTELRPNTPAILNVNGHVGEDGKAIEYKQKRCITLARHGILALNLEWLGMGELHLPENTHGYGGDLDLVGLNDVGLFYLEMRRGLDYLCQHPDVDRSRLGLTGLSGGGWQTIVLAALDERVTAAVPVAGFGATETTAVLYGGSLGDLEQHPADAFVGADYPDLVGLVAPRPMLLVFNAVDDCCFRSLAVKALNYDAVKPIYKLYGREAALNWHENLDPGTHNYQIDNRRAAYRFFCAAFHLPDFDEDPSVAREIKSRAELAVGISKDNLTLLGLARKIAAQIRRSPIPHEPQALSRWASEQRAKLVQVVRMEPVKVSRPWVVDTAKSQGIESLSYVFRMGNGLSANGVRVAATERTSPSPVTIVLDDGGKANASATVVDRVNRGESVLALDLLFMGDAWRPEADRQALYRPATPGTYSFVLQSLGQRSLGLEAAQLLAIAQWMAAQEGAPRVRLECTGIRSEVVALVAAALEPGLFSNVVVHRAMRSLGYVLAKPVPPVDAPELFCLDLYCDFDLDALELMAAPTKVSFETVVD